MQEPILFNRSIKDNIMYGNMDAGNFEIRKSALLANATQFIESDIEQMDKEDRIKKMREDTSEKLTELAKDYRNYGELGINMDKVEDDLAELYYYIFKKADDNAKKAIN